MLLCCTTPHHKMKWIRSNEILEKAVESDFISCELKKEIMDYRDIIRHETAHPKTPVHFSNLGLRYNKDWSWGGKDQEPIIPGSEPCARKGIDLFLRIVKHLLDTNAGKKVKR